MRVRRRDQAREAGCATASSSAARLGQEPLRSIHSTARSAALLLLYSPDMFTLPGARFGLLSALVVTVLLSTAAAAQSPSALTDEQMEQFLRTARVVRTTTLSKGVTGSIRATLSDGTLTHDAHIQTIEESKREFRSRRGVELNFRDSWQFNIAAYEIDRLIGLQMVPVSVARRWRGRQGAFTWWVDDVMMDEGERIKKQMRPPDLRCWNEQVRLLRVFDQLIDNSDRNLGNMLITQDWRVWAIDHTRAFRHFNKPRSPERLTTIDRTVLQRLASFDEAELRKAVGRSLGIVEIQPLLARRDAIVRHFEALGEEALYDRDSAGACATYFLEHLLVRRDALRIGGQQRRPAGRWPLLTAG